MERDWSDLIDKSGPGRVNPVRVLSPRTASPCEGLSVRSIDLSRLGCSSLATSPSRLADSSRRNFWARRPRISPRYRLPMAVDGQGVDPVELTRALAFGKSPEPLDPTIRREDHDELVLGRNAHDQPEDTPAWARHR